MARHRNVEWTVTVRESDLPSIHHAQLAVLMDIRDELQTIRALAECHRIPRALDAAVRIDKRLAKKFKLP